MYKAISKLILLLIIPLAVNTHSGEIDQFQIKRSDDSLIDYYIQKNIADSQTKPLSKTLLLIVQGSDCNSIVHNASINDLKAAWPEADLLLVEKYAITSALTYSTSNGREDCPADTIKMDSLEQRVSDILEVIKVTDSTGIYDQMLVIGGSEGAVVANIVASQTNAIDATASFNGGGRWFLDDVLHSIKYGKANTPELKAEINGFSEMASHIVANRQMEIEVSGHGSRWWRSVLQLDQLEILNKTKSPILILQSEEDQSVSVINTDKMIKSLLKNGKSNISYKKYAGLDHSFRDSSGDSKLADVVKDINQWFLSTIEIDTSKTL